MLTGALVSGVQMAVSMSNTGGAWDNAKKYLEAGRSEHARELGGKGSDCHKAAVIGDTVGDPLKDTSGPSLNILVKLMAVESLVFAPFFTSRICGRGDGFVFALFGKQAGAEERACETRPAMHPFGHQPLFCTVLCGEQPRAWQELMHTMQTIPAAVVHERVI
eukprot:TRINITY_DN3278_c0_g1_i1.p2 TRINITY_DN3278_c0_g1~~TRINITY_DN3278_c0_g1_i1.p2  ORF type:complete len:171 (+),score=21.36 TRINITY_DN3278_c0_g1_i1:27-515(+)